MSKSSTAVSVKPKKARPPRQRVPASGIRCTHVDAAGRRCRSLALKSVRGAKAGYTSGLCPAHATEDRMFRETELVGKYLDARPKYFKGPHRPRLGDLAYSELAMFPVRGERIWSGWRQGSLDADVVSKRWGHSK